MLQLDFVTYWAHAVLKAVFLQSLWFFQSWHAQNCSNKLYMIPAFWAIHLKQVLKILLMSFFVFYFANFQWRHAQSIALYLLKLSIRYRMIQFELVLVTTYNMYSCGYCQLSYSTRQPRTSCIITSSLNRHLPFSDFPLRLETIQTRQTRN